MIRCTVVFITVVLYLASLATLFAAEVKNLRSGQDGKRAFVQYDLAGMPGEKEADVAVTLEASGIRYTPDKLSLSGDFGKAVKVGVGKRIWWDLLKDMPSGFDGEIGWEIDATSTAGFIAALKAEEENKAKEQTIQGHKSQSDFVSEGFHYYKDVVVDTRTGLMWARNANIAGKKMDWSDATKWVEGSVFSSRLDYAGYGDWRLPTQEELALLAERGGSRPAEWFNANGFNNVQADWYWSGTENGSYRGQTELGQAGVVDMASGNVYSSYGKNNDDYVWPVRLATAQQGIIIASEQTKNDQHVREEAEHQSIEKTKAEQVLDTTDVALKEHLELVSKFQETQALREKELLHIRGDVVIDKRNGLMWTRNGKLAPEKLSFGQAKSLIEKLNSNRYAGFSNWRLPNVPEFKKLYSSAKIMAGESRKPLEVFREIFIDYQVWYYWTSYVLPTGGLAGNRVVAFDLEDGTGKYFPTDELHYVFAVR